MKAIQQDNRRGRLQTHFRLEPDVRLINFQCLLVLAERGGGEDVLVARDPPARAGSTVQHLLGIDYEKFTDRFQGRQFRLTDVHSQAVKGILA